MWHTSSRRTGAQTHLRLLSRVRLGRLFPDRGKLHLWCTCHASVYLTATAHNIHLLRMSTQPTSSMLQRFVISQPKVSYNCKILVLCGIFRWLVALSSKFIRLSQLFFDITVIRRHCTPHKVRYVWNSMNLANSPTSSWWPHVALSHFTVYG